MLRRTALFLTLLAAGIFTPVQISQAAKNFDVQNSSGVTQAPVDQFVYLSGMEMALPAIPPLLLPGDPLKNGNEEQQGFITIRGYLINFSGGDIDLKSRILLTIYTGDQKLEILTTQLRSDQSFDFSLIPYNPGWTYVASFTHNGIEFKSDMIDGSVYSSGSTVSTKIWVFDSTSDASLLRGEGMHVSLIFRQEGKVHIVESMLFYNPTSLVIIPSSSESPVITFALDKDYSSLAFLDHEEINELRTVQGGFGDWQFIYPGMVHQVLFEYDLPFDGNTNFEFSLPMRMDSIMVMVQGSNGRIACSNPMMSQEIGNMANPSRVFNSIPQDNGTSIVVHCVDRVRILAWFLGVSGVLLTGVLIFVILLQRNKKAAKLAAVAPEAQSTEILDAIIALEDQFKAGEISAESYETMRAEMVRKLETK